MVLQGFVISHIVFGYEDPTYNPKSYAVIEFFFTQFSGIKTVQSLILEKQCKGAGSSMILSMRSDDLTLKPSPSNS